MVGVDCAGAVVLGETDLRWVAYHAYAASAVDEQHLAPYGIAAS